MSLANQIKQLDLKQPIAIIGTGLTGKSCSDLLQLASIDYCIFDERDTIPDTFKNSEVRIHTGKLTKDTFNDFGTVLISPGVDTRRDCFNAAQDKLLTDIELFAQLTNKKIIGVTASNGKSTVVTLIHEVTQAANRDYILCGNIGLPVLRALRENEATCKGYIIELSSYHLERAPSLKLAIGAWLNVSPDHLDRYDSYDDYVATKAKLFTQSAQIIANADDVDINTYANQHTNKTLFSQQQTNCDYYFIDGSIYHQRRAVFNLKDFAQIGNHHADNLMAVFAVADKLGINKTITAKACRSFKPLASRSVVVGEKNGVTFINDSKGTNVGATVAAISGLKQPIILLAGGVGKKQSFNQLAQAAKGKVKQAILFGQDAELIEKALSKDVVCQGVKTLEEAVSIAIIVAQTGDVVMLSPACASFDMFSSYLKRGEYFESLVKEWINAAH